MNKVKLGAWLLAAFASLAATACRDSSDAGRRADVAGAEVSKTAPGLNGSPALAVRPEVLAGRSRPGAVAYAPDRGSLLSFVAGAPVASVGPFLAHQVSISEAHALASIGPGRRISIPRPGGGLLHFEYVRHVEHPDGNWTWIGRLAGSVGAEAIITFGENAVFGSVSDARGEPLRLTTRNGATYLEQADPLRIIGAEGVARRRASDTLLPPHQAAMLADSATGPQARAPVAAAGASAGNTVDVVLGYTAGFEAAQGGASQAITRLRYLVDATNQGYLNSQIDAQVRLVGTVRVDYPDATDNGDALEKLSGYRSGSGPITPDPAFGPLRQARNTYGADLVSLVRKFQTPENDGCGIAWLIGGGQSAIDGSDAPFGYSVVSDGVDADESDGKSYFCRDETLAHELGHNMGSAHDRDTADGDDNVLQAKEYGRYAYSFGYKTSSSGGNFYTIMAYGSAGQVRYRVFSNPRIAFCGGNICGQDNAADNARSLSQTIPLIAAFYAGLTAPDPTPAPPGGLAGDLDGDRKDDLVWYNASLNAIYYWLMDGDAVRQGRGNWSVPPGSTPRLVADFNADGRQDILFASDSNIWIYNTTAEGGFVSTYLAPYPAGWQLAGAGDSDGDGTADLVWFHPATRQLYTWIVQGSALRRGIPGPAAPPGTTPRAVADFNGDGVLDVLVPSANDIWVYLGNGLGGFASAYIAMYPPGWNLVGARDLDADRKVDLVWYHPTSREVYYWLMNGGAIRLGKGGVFAPAGTPPRLMADYSGDGRADVLLANTQELWMLIATAGGSFTNQYVAPYPAGWN